MTTTISPGLGHGLGFTQQGVGTTPGYDAVDFRRAVSGPLLEGAMDGTSYMVTQRGAGANMSVDIAANAGVYGVAAYVQGDAVAGQALYAVAPHNAVINETIAAAHASLPRVDRVILEVLDNVHDASGSNLARTRVLTGTATSGDTLDNPTGATAVPNSALLLADILVGAGATSITNANIRDRRKWARGAFVILTHNSNYTVSGSLALLDATNLNPRIECSGSPLRVTLHGQLSVVSGAAQYQTDLFVDGASANMSSAQTVPNTTAQFIESSWVIVPSAGSHKIGPAAQAITNAITFVGSASASIKLIIEEIVRQNTANNSVTTG